MTEKLWELIIEVKQTSGEADPRDIAKLVRDRITADQLSAAVDEMLPDYTRIAIHRHWQEPVPEPTGTAAAAPRTRAKRSRDTIRSAVRRVLDMSICINEQAGEWMHWGDMTEEHIQLAGDLKVVKGQQSIAAGERILKMRDVLKEHGAVRVRDLPEDVVLAHKP